MHDADDKSELHDGIKTLESGNDKLRSQAQASEVKLTILVDTIGKLSHNAPR